MAMTEAQKNAIRRQAHERALAHAKKRSIEIGQQVELLTWNTHNRNDFEEVMLPFRCRFSTSQDGGMLRIEGVNGMDITLMDGDSVQIEGYETLQPRIGVIRAEHVGGMQ